MIITIACLGLGAVIAYIAIVGTEMVRNALRDAERKVDRDE